jgi:signal transduction histidine kinase
LSPPQVSDVGPSDRFSNQAAPLAVSPAEVEKGWDHAYRANHKGERARPFKHHANRAIRITIGFKANCSDLMQTGAEIQAERIKATFQQIPAAVLVTVVNASVMATVLSYPKPNRGVYAWLAVVALVSAARFTVWWLQRTVALSPENYWRWSIASVCSALAAGLLWGGGSVLLQPNTEVYLLFWVFLIGGMCAGAAALHFPHWPTTIAFILPACLPIATQFALEGSLRRVAAAIMIVVFVAALSATSWRASRNFGEMLRLRFDLAHRTRELDAANEQLRTEIAEHRATQATLFQAQKMEAMGQLTGAIAHDFNNLLSVVLVNLGLVRKHVHEDDRKAERLLDASTQAAERGAALTQRLLAFGRRQALMPEAVDVPALVGNISMLLTSSLGKSVRLATHFPDALPCVEVDPNQLELALLNLATNARDAMSNGGVLTISAREELVVSSNGIAPGCYVVLGVADTGEGMDEATLARATEPFFTTKVVGKGTGLGLSMVHGFAAQSGGQFVLRSRKGVGTVAELWLPRAAAAATQVAEPIRSQRPGAV